MGKERKDNVVSAQEPASNKGFPRIDIATLYQEVFPQVQRFVLANSGCSDDAKDMFQEAMSAFWVRSVEDQAFDSSNPGGFVYRVAKNKWLDQVRSARHRTKAKLVVETDDPIEEYDEMLTERIEHLQEIYSKLDEKCRTVLDQFYYEKKDLRTIAASVGVDEGSIRTMKYRCMMKLRAFNKESGMQE